MKFLLLGSLLLILCGSVVAQDYDIVVSLDGTQAATGSPATGAESGSGYAGCYYTLSTKSLTIAFTFTGLTGTTTAAHIHGPADPGQTAGVEIPFNDITTGVTSGTYNHTYVLTGTEETDLLAGKYYVNIHTTTFSGGEIRGQLTIGSVLPVELTAFTALARGRNVELVWKTATEVNNYGFDIERIPLNPPFQGGSRIHTADEVGGFQKVSFVDGAGTSNVPHNYSYTDKSASIGKFEYRLKQIDRDGKFEYSKSVEVEVGVAPNVFGLSQNYPNPFNPSTHIEFSVPSNGRATLKIFNVLGEEVATLYNDEAEAGKYHQIEFDAAGLATGLYFSRLEFGGNVQIRKMLLLK